MRTIWKYTLTPGKSTILMPADATMLSVQMQHNVPTMWAFIPNDDAPKVPREFFIYGTGHQVNEAGLRFLGTFQMMSAMPLVFHVFEKAQEGGLP
jgi:hypothetical protein